MKDVPFYKTRMGEKFFCKTMPDLIRQLERFLGVLHRIPTVAWRRCGLVLHGAVDRELVLRPNGQES